MDLSFSVAAHIARPVSEVFEAVADPARLSAYFTTGGARGRLETGATVSWDFHDFPGAFPVHVDEVEPNSRIVLRWAANDPGSAESYATIVTFTFAPVDDDTRTLVRISERGWPQTGTGLEASYGNCYGWTQMLCALKVWLEHGINLREGMFK
ncbi:SRPBCC family protein [soil metagenome]